MQFQLSLSKLKHHIVLMLLLGTCSFIDRASSILSYEGLRNYGWEEVIVPNENLNHSISSAIVHASDIVGGQNVYVSIATMSSRVDKVYETVISILEQTVMVTRIFVIISKEKFLMDEGISPGNIPSSLLSLASSNPVSIIYTKNIGPHRKLLPVLSKFWKEDCIIITIDDDKGIDYPRNTIMQLLKYYIASKKESIIALRGRRLGLCHSNPWFRFTRYMSWPGFPRYHGTKEMLVLPTGTGGVLYRPKFFHPIVFDERLRNYTMTGDDITFRLATMAKDVFVVGGCRDTHHIRRGKMTSHCPQNASIVSYNYHSRTQSVRGDVRRDVREYKVKGNSHRNSNRSIHPNIVPSTYNNNHMNNNHQGRDKINQKYLAENGDDIVIANDKQAIEEQDLMMKALATIHIDRNTSISIESSSSSTPLTKQVRDEVRFYYINIKVNQLSMYYIVIFSRRFIN